VPTVIAVDLFVNDSVSKAHVVFPAAAFTESSGSHTNLEGRITAIRQKVTPPGTARSDLVIAAELARRLGHDLGLETPSNVWEELGPRSAVHGDVSSAAIEADVDGVLITATGRVAFAPPDQAVSREPVNAYALRLVTARRMFDNGTMVQQSPHLAGFAGQASLRVNPYDFNRVGVADGEEVRVSAPKGSVNVAARVDPGVPKGIVVLDYNRSGADARVLLDPGATSIDIRLESKGGKA